MGRDDFNEWCQALARLGFDPDDEDDVLRALAEPIRKIPRAELDKMDLAAAIVLSLSAGNKHFFAVEVLGRIGGIPRSRTTEVLDSVGLADRAGDRVKTYSLGMKQRLGIAAALLKDPELLILDEPANGLDPAGIKEVRELVRRLGTQGRTVFVSSHILSEVKQTCDRVAILSRGRCVAQGPVGSVLEAGRASGVLVKVEDGPRAAAILKGAGIETTATNGRLRVDMNPAEGARITKVLADAGIYLSELRPDEEDLEEVFLRLTQDERGE